MLTTQVIQPEKTWNKKDCIPSYFLGERVRFDQDEIEWIATHRLRFASYASALIEAKQKGWGSLKGNVSHVPDCNEEAHALQDTESPTEREFERQKQAFESIPLEELAPYHGQFVAAIDGVIVGSDEDLMVLDQRVLERYGDVPVYITKVGERAIFNIPTPFLR